MRVAQQNAYADTHARILGFELPTEDWKVEPAERSFQVSPVASEGQAAARVDLSGDGEFTLVNRAPLTSLGEVGHTLTIDLNPPTLRGFSTLRVVVDSAEQSLFWHEFDIVQLQQLGLVAGEFNRVEFPLGDAAQRLSGQYSDLTVRVIVNGGAGTYLIDRVSFGGDADFETGSGGTSASGGAGGSGGLPSTGGGSGGTPNATGGSDGGAPTGPRPIETLEVRTPRGVSLDEVIFAAQGDGLSVNDRVILGRFEGQDRASVASIGWGSFVQLTNIGAGAEAKSVDSEDDVATRVGSILYGDLRTAGAHYPQAGANVVGDVFPGATVTPYEVETIGYRFPSVMQPMGVIEHGHDVDLAPGGYGATTVQDDATIRLRSGTYYFDELFIESSGGLSIDSGEGPVFVVVREGFRSRGLLTQTGGHRDVAFIVLGNSDLAIEGFFAGQVIAPRAAINLSTTYPSGHTQRFGTFVGNSIVAHQNTTYEHSPFERDDCDTACGIMWGCEGSEPYVPCEGEAPSCAPNCEPGIVCSSDAECVGACGDRNGAHFEREGQSVCWGDEETDCTIPAVFFQNCGASASACGQCLGGPEQPPTYQDPPDLPDHEYTPPAVIDGTTRSGLIEDGIVDPTAGGGGTLSGALVGTSSVSPNGAYGYSIPFRVPPGVNGHTPRLGLEYSSEGGVDVAGVGWRATGFSKIERCTDRAWTGRPKAVQFNDGTSWDDPAMDAFCLDGQRLVPTVSDSPDVVEFSPLIAEASKVRGYKYYGEFIFFRVWKRSGAVLTYEREHRVTRYDPETDEELDGTLGWYLSEVQDKSGNPIYFHYSTEEADLDHEPVPKRVVYAEGRFEVRYSYTGTEKPYAQCIGGACVHGPPDLTEVAVVQDDRQVWSYHLDYERAPFGGTQRLHHIMWCDGFGACQEPTEFVWKGVGDTTGTQFRLLWETPVFGVHSALVWTKPTLADFNGDGLLDLLYIAIDPDDPALDEPSSYPPQGSIRVLVHFGKGGRFEDPTSLPSWNRSGPLFEDLFEEAVDITSLFDDGKFDDPELSRFADFDGDGATEILAYYRQLGQADNGIYQMLRWNGAQFVRAMDPTWTFNSSSGQRFHLGDADGDGRVDVLRRDTEVRVDSQGDPELLVTYGLWKTVAPGGPDGMILGPREEVASFFERQAPFSDATLDLNSNGLVTLLRPNAALVGLDQFDEALRRKGARYIAGQRFADFNGDGLVDVWGYGSLSVCPNDSICAGYNLGHDFANVPYPKLGDVPEHDFPMVQNGGGHEPGHLVGDFNGDGRADLLLLATGGIEDSLTPFVRFHDAKPVPYVSTPTGLVRREDLFATETLKRPVHRGDGNKNWVANATGDVDGNGLSEALLLELDENGLYRFRLYGLAMPVGDRAALVETKGDLMVEVRPPRLKPEQVEYASISSADDGESPLYQAKDVFYWPHRSLQTGRTVVERFSGAEFDYIPQEYRYQDGRVDITGLGFMGFGCVLRGDTLTARVTKTCYDVRTQNRAPQSHSEGHFYPLKHRPRLEETRSYVDEARSRVRIVSKVGGWTTVRSPQGTVNAVVPTQSWTRVYEGEPQTGDLWSDDEILGDETLQLTTYTDYEFDSWGNPTSVVTTTTENGDKNGNGTTEVVRTEVDSEYRNLTQPGEGSWRIGKLLSRTITKTRAGASQSRTTAYTYDLLGRLRETISEPDGAANEKVVVERTRDAFGNVTKQQVHASGETRTTTITYDADGLHPTSTTNNLGHRSQFVTHPALGEVVASQSPDGAWTTSRFDMLGRLHERVHPRGRVQRLRYGYGDLAASFGVNTQAQYSAVVAEDTLAPTEIVVKNEWGKVVELGRVNADGTTSVSEIGYNLRGLPANVALPHREGTAVPGRRELRYDWLERKTVDQNPDGSAVLTSYPNVFETVTSDEEGVTTSVVKSVDGLVLTSYEHDGTTRVATSFDYHPWGELQHVQRPDGDEFEFGIDRRGRTVSEFRNDTGWSEVILNGFGEIESSWAYGSDHTGRDSYLFVNVELDGLGRTRHVDVTCTDANLCRDEELEFTWDAAPGAAGKLVRAHSLTDGIASTFQYADDGFLTKRTLFLDGEAFEHEYEYGTGGRLTALSYPTVPGAPRLEVQLEYEQLTSELGRVYGSGSATYWNVLERAPDGHILATNQTFDGTWPVVRSFDYDQKTRRLRQADSIRSGWTAEVIQRYEYDYYQNGNLEARREFGGGYSPDASPGTGVVEESFGFDYANRLESWRRISGERTQDWEYLYSRGGRILRADQIDETGATSQDAYLYGQNGAPPNAVTRFNEDTFAYDAGGRMIERKSEDRGDLRLINGWFDLPFRVVRGGDGQQTTEVMSLRYDAFGNRVVKQGDGTKTLYVGATYERRDSTNASGHPQTKHVQKIYAQGHLVAQISHTEGADPADDERVFVHGDPLASSTTIIDDTGNLEQSLYYSAWGARLDEGGALQNENPYSSVTVGFTGHEHDDELGLINMKARLYDPRVRRVLTIDPILSGLTGGAWNASTYKLKQQVDRHDPASLLTGKGLSDHWQPQPQEADPEDGKAPQGGSLLQDPLKGNTPALALPSDEAYQPAIGSSPVNAGTSDSFGEQASAASPATPAATTVSDEGYAPDSGEWGTVEQKTRDPGTFGGSKANPYAYSFNNPVTYVDPDGEFVFTAIAVAVAAGAAADAALFVGATLAAASAGIIVGQVVRQVSGSYTNTHATGKRYHGKGTRARSQESGRRIAKEHDDPLVSTDWTSAPTHRDAFKDESRRIDADGGARNKDTYNKRESPGKRYREQDREKKK